MPFSKMSRIEWVGIVAACLMVGCSWASYRAYADASRWASHSVQVRREIVLLARDAGMAQRGQRGYLLTGRPEYLKPYEVACQSFPERLARLKELTKDNERQRRRLAVVGEEANVLFAELADTVRRTREGHKDGAYVVVNTGVEERAANRLLVELDDCTAEEDRLLVQRAGDQTWMFRAFVTALVLCGVSVGVAAGFAYRAWRSRP